MRDFTPNPDDANTEIRLLETKLGLPHGPFIEYIDEANVRIDELEGRVAALDTERSNVSVGTAAGRSTDKNPTTLKVTGLERAIAASSGIKTHIEVPSIPLFGLQRAIAANIRRLSKN